MSDSLTTCRDVLTDISSYLDGDLEATACEVIEQHCVTCSSCAALVTGLRETIGLCRRAGTLPLPDAVRARVRESVRQLLESTPDNARK